MSSPSHRSPSPPPLQLQPRQSRSPTTSMSTSTSTAATTAHTTPSKTGGSTHQHHHHLPVGHTLHSPAQSASGDFIQGNPEDAGGLHTSTSRGNILLPPSSLPGTGTAAATPADLLSVASAASRTPGSSVAAYSRPASPSSSSAVGGGAGAGALLPPSSPSMLGAASAASHTATAATRSRPTSPTRSRSPIVPSSPRSPSLKQQQQQHQQGQAPQDADVLSMSSSTPQLDSSAVFERDVEFANDHLLTGSEAIDLAAAPVLSEVALAVTSNDISSIAPSPPSSNILAGLGGIGGSGSGASGTASPLLAHQSLDSTILSSSPQLPSNAVLFNNEGQQITSSSSASSSALGYGTTNTVPLSEQLRRSSGGANSALASGSGSERITARPTSDEFTISPPPSLSLSPSASTNSPISSTPGSPIQSLHPSHHLASGAGGGLVGGTGTPVGASGGAQFGHALNSMEELDPEAPLEGVETGLTSPPGSSSAMSGISLSGSKDSKRRLSMISYADIINSERLSDTHSGFSSPTPSSALSLSAAALPMQSGQQSPSPAHYGAAAIASTGGTANIGSPPISPGLGSLAAGTGSALYSPLTSPEGSIASPPISGSTGLVSDKEERSTSGAREEPTGQEERTMLQKPVNNRTDTMSTTATEVLYMPGQMPLHTPPAHHDYKEDKDVTPTSSSIRKASPPYEGPSEQEGGSATADTETLKHSTSSSSWSMVEMGKALVGSAAGAVGSVLGTSGIGNGDDDDDDNEEEKRKAAKSVQADH